MNTGLSSGTGPLDRATRIAAAAAAAQQDPSAPSRDPSSRPPGSVAAFTLRHHPVLLWFSKEV